MCVLYDDGSVEDLEYEFEKPPIRGQRQVGITEVVNGTKHLMSTYCHGAGVGDMGVAERELLCTFDIAVSLPVRLPVAALHVTNRRNFICSRRQSSSTDLAGYRPQYLLDVALKPANMEAELSKIRPHTSSGLLHQKVPANLLAALEGTFKEQNTERTPAAYFGGLVTALESTVQKERADNFSLGEGDMLPAEDRM